MYASNRSTCEIAQWKWNKHIFKLVFIWNVTAKNACATEVPTLASCEFIHLENVFFWTSSLSSENKASPVSMQHTISKYNSYDTDTDTTLVLYPRVLHLFIKWS